jgi:predicted RNA-binding Zn ribbon-like protein
VVGQVPEMRDRFNFEKLAVPLKAGLGLEIDGLVKSEEESAQDIQQAQAQMQEQQEQAARLESDVYESKAVVDEKKLVAADIRKGIIQERLAKIKEGDQLVTQDLPDLLKDTSILMLEQMQLAEQENVRLQEEEQQQQIQAAEQESQSGQGEAGIPPESSGRPEVAAAL